MRKYILLVMLVSMMLPFYASAHEGGLTYEVQQGDYFIDIGYTADLVSGQPVRFDLSISKEEGGAPIVFSDAWVRIEGESLLFAGPIAYGEFGRPGFTYSFTGEGDHKISVRFEDGGKELAQADFTVHIEKEGFDKRFLTELLGVIILSGIFGSVFYFKRNKKGGI